MIPLAVLLGVSKIVHDEETAENAVKYVAANRGTNMDHFSNLMRKRKQPKVKDLPEADY